MVNEDLPGIVDDTSRPSSGGRKEYIVVARRYRPQAFEELVGQEHVARALASAISTNRVGHAYLFTGARGVGKTSAARILAKCLNCERGPTPIPCNQCESCLSVATGDDVDVLEIDGASNRGIEEMRELRHNVAVRPSRSRFKIYIIDEVHMLTREAFNALLKTLEEPPEHVKFIFCTTEAEKIPVTILSRCQRFDFAGIEASSIVGRLQQIVTAEGVEAEPQALALLSRRAGGSMRDSQSLLEQLLALGKQRITVDDVNNLLGTAADDRMMRLVGYLIARDAASAITELDAAIDAGVDTGQLLDQLLIYFRDIMVACVGGSPDILMQVDATAQQMVVAQARQLGLHTVLAVMQVLDHTINRLRYSTHGRVLAELALARICQLGDLDELPGLINQLKSGGGASLIVSAPAQLAQAARPAIQSSAPPPLATTGNASSETRAAAGDSVKKNDEPAGSESARASVAPAALGPAASPALNVAGPATPLSAVAAQQVWQQALAQLQGLVADYASQASSISSPAPGVLVATFARAYNSCKSFCEQPDQLQKIERALAEAAGAPLKLNLVLAEGSEPAAQASAAARPVAARDRLREKMSHPMVSRAMELFEAHPIKVEEPGA